METIRGERGQKDHRRDGKSRPLSGEACARVSAHDFPDDPRRMTTADETQDVIRLIRRDQGDEADTHVEDLVEFEFLDCALGAEELKEGRDFPGILPNHDIAIRGQYAG
jgi:hypothetical protein